MISQNKLPLNYSNWIIKPNGREAFYIRIDKFNGSSLPFKFYKPIRASFKFIHIKNEE
jgi:hypothetical protein